MAIAIARHSETKSLVSVSAHDDGRVVAGPAPDAQQTWLHDPRELLAAAGPTGRWRHFKGGVYRFLGRAEADDGTLVIYLDADGEVWARPEAMVTETIERDGYHGPRFFPEVS